MVYYTAVHVSSSMYDLRMLPTVFGEKAENHFKFMSLRKGALYCRKPLSYYVSQSNNQTYNTAPLNTVKSILKIKILYFLFAVIVGVSVIDSTYYTIGLPGLYPIFNHLDKSVIEIKSVLGCPSRTKMLIWTFQLLS